eukprot:6736687-Lingulodinium_polyedra.AAC.1
MHQWDRLVQEDRGLMAPIWMQGPDPLELDQVLVGSSAAGANLLAGGEIDFGMLHNIDGSAITGLGG